MRKWWWSAGRTSKKESTTFCWCDTTFNAGTHDNLMQPTALVSTSAYIKTQQNTDSTVAHRLCDGCDLAPSLRCGANDARGVRPGVDARPDPRPGVGGCEERPGVGGAPRPGVAGVGASDAPTLRGEALGDAPPLGEPLPAWKRRGLTGGLPEESAAAASPPDAGLEAVRAAA